MLAFKDTQSHSCALWGWCVGFAMGYRTKKKEKREHTFPSFLLSIVNFKAEFPNTDITGS